MAFTKKVLMLMTCLAGIQFVTGHTGGLVPQKLFLSVYYESRCPDSKSFILRQLVPALQQLPDYIMLRMVPFGKAKSINNGYGGFRCQHGPSECLGNMIQGCVLDLLMGASDAKKLEYVACEMRTYAASNGDLSCVQRAHISPDEVKECVTTGKGTQLQLQAEYLTRLVHPKFVPTITVDGIFNQETQNHALLDLVGALCSFLKQAKECAQYYNKLALRSILM